MGSSSSATEAFVVLVLHVASQGGMSVLRQEKAPCPTPMPKAEKLTRLLRALPWSFVAIHPRTSTAPPALPYGLGCYVRIVGPCFVVHPHMFLLKHPPTRLAPFLKHALLFYPVQSALKRAISNHPPPSLPSPPRCTGQTWEYQLTIEGLKRGSGRTAPSQPTAAARRGPAEVGTVPG